MTASVPAGDRAGGTTRYRAGMGFNPFRPHSNTALDVALVIGALVLTIAVIVWAVAGG